MRLLYIIADLHGLLKFRASNTVPDIKTITVKKKAA